MSMLKSKMKEAATRVVGSLPDVAVLLGAGLVSYGAHMIYAPAGFIVGGIFMMLGGIFVARSAL